MLTMIGDMWSMMVDTVTLSCLYNLAELLPICFGEVKNFLSKYFSPIMLNSCLMSLQFKLWLIRGLILNDILGMEGYRQSEISS